MKICETNYNLPFNQQPEKMNNVYKRIATYHCLGSIYRQGLLFFEAGRHLIESRQENFFIPGMINICLATEIFLKSINATTSNLEDEIEVNGTKIFAGRDKSFKIAPGSTGHALSKIFEKLPEDAKKKIIHLAKEEGFSGKISEGLKIYDDVFVEWRYIYEQNDPKSLGTHPLFQICNAINLYCQQHQNLTIIVKSDLEDQTEMPT